MISTEQIEFTIEKDQLTTSTVTAENIRGKGSIQIKKVDKADDEILLEGVEFKLYKQDDSLLETKKTNNIGVINFTDLPYGIYTIIETGTLASYVPNNEPLEIELNSTTNEDGVIEYITVKNKKKDYSVTLTKYNLGKSLRLEGAVFELRKETLVPGEYEVVEEYTVDQLSTNVDGIINLKELKVGKYQLVEMTAPRGYRLDRTPVEFTITENQTTTIEVEKINRRRPSDDDEPNPGGGGGNPPKPTDPTDPADPDSPNPTTPSDSPKYTNPQVPDPNDPNSPEVFVLIDENGTPLGTYFKKQNPDGTFVYVDEDGIPLGSTLLPKTGDNMAVLLLLIVCAVSLFSAIYLVIFKRKRYNQ